MIGYRSQTEKSEEILPYLRTPNYHKIIQENKAASSLIKKNKLKDRTIPALAGVGAAGAAYGYGTDKAAFEIVNDILSK